MTHLTATWLKTSFLKLLGAKIMRRKKKQQRLIAAAIALVVIIAAFFALHLTS